MATAFDDLTADEEKQMDEMREADYAPDPEPEEVVPAETDDPVDPVEAADDTPDEEPREEPKETRVPYGALREERDRRQRLEDELAASSAKMAQMEQTLQKILTKDTPPEQVPSFEDDPDAYHAWQLDQINRRLENTEKTTAEQRAAQEKQKQAQQFLSMYAEKYEEFGSKQPDLKDAYEHVYKMRDDELRLTGYSNPEERRRILEFEEEQVVARAFRVGENPAARMYELAKLRGYRPAQKKSDADKVANLAKGQEATSSLAGSGGQGERPVTLQRLAELDGADFDREWAKAQKKGLLG